MLAAPPELQTAATLANWTVTAPGYQAIAVIGDNSIPGGNLWATLAAWPAPQTASGRYYFAADGDFTNGVEAMISQLISGLTIGAPYQLSFDWGTGVCTTVPPCDTPPPSNSGWDVSFGSSTASVNSGPVPFQSFSGWHTYTNVFTATATSQTLSFLSKGGPTGVPPFSLLDNVSVREVRGPVGVLGAATAFSCSRCIRRRIRRG